MPPGVIELLAERFRALADPARLRLLAAMRGGERTVTWLVEETGLGQANVSRHLALLLALGFVRRRREGSFAFYALADDDVFRLCDTMCGHLAAETEARRQLLARRAGASRT